MNDQVERIKQNLRKYEEFLAKMKERGYDVDNLPPLTEQQRDELDMAIHNAKRSGKFDWDMRDVNVPRESVMFAQIVLVVSAVIPLCLAGYFFVEADGILRFLVPAIVLVCLLHMYYGFKWAGFVVAIGSMVPAYSQLLMLGNFQTEERVFLFFVLVVITINSYLLLKSKSVAQFLGRQRACLSHSNLHKLRLSRLTVAVLLIGAIAADVVRLVLE
jgi:hypothetical protein